MAFSRLHFMPATVYSMRLTLKSTHVPSDLAKLDHEDPWCSAATVACRSIWRFLSCGCHINSRSPTRAPGHHAKLTREDCTLNAKQQTIAAGESLYSSFPGSSTDVMQQRARAFLARDRAQYFRLYSPLSRSYDRTANAGPSS
jgi:hypothetical protein